jgi:hypothetical protein
MDDSSMAQADGADHLLGKIAPANAGELFKDSLRIRTTQRLRWQGWLHRLRLVTCLAVFYAAGLLTMGRLGSPHAGGDQGDTTSSSLPDTVVTAPESAAKAREPRPALDRTQCAVALEWQALDSLEKRPDLFRAAGDRYLETSDVQSALRCYRNFLDASSENEAAIAPDDNWLLMALKESKQREKSYAKTSG